MNGKFTLISGPCVIENRDITLRIAERLKNAAAKFGVDFIFKASFDKANRLSADSFRGVGLKKGLKILDEVKKRAGCRILTDVHEVCQVEEAAEVADVLQIPAFLCRQTDLVTAAAGSKKIVNIKKGQFMAPWDMKNIVEKARSTGNNNIWLTERGSCFGYNRLVVDMVSLEYMKKFGCKIFFDLTHSLQLPGGLGGSTGGQREFAYALARAAAGVGVDGFFIEVHPNPKKALSDSATSLDFAQLDKVVGQVLKIL